MRISGVEIVEREGMARLRADVDFETGERRHHDLWVEVPAAHRDILAVSAHGFLAASMFPAMRVGEDIIYDYPIDLVGKRGLAELRRAFCCLFPKWVRPIKVDYRGGEPPPRPLPNGRGVFFSAGVDAFHTAYRVHTDPLLLESGARGYLLPIMGFDVPMDRPDLFAPVLRASEDVVKRTGWTMVPIKSNLRDEFYPPPIHLGWTELGFIPTLVGVGYALTGGLGKIHIALGGCYNQFDPAASSASTDALWTSGALDVIPVGGDASRMQKLQELLPWSDLMVHLHVCHRLDGTNPLNCGYCKKCVRTILALYAAGALPHAASTYPPEISQRVEDIAGIAWSRSKLDLDIFHEVVKQLEAHPVDSHTPAVLANLRRRLKSMEPSNFKKFVREVDAKYLGAFIDRTRTTLRRASGRR